MIGALQGTSENLTLSERELSACGPVAGEGGRVLRAYCPFHGSDRQRSLRLDLRSGRFSCFACGAWGYTQQAREQWRRKHAGSMSEAPASGERSAGRQGHPAAHQEAHRLSEGLSAAATAGITSVRHGEVSTSHTREGLEASLSRYQEALPGSWGEEYLHRRHVPLQLALEYGLGYAVRGTWEHKGSGKPLCRDWKWGRVVAPMTDSQGRLVNLYGRAVGEDDKVPKCMRHDKLGGEGGLFNARALREGEGPLWVCEGVFDALALIADGKQRSVALIGVNGWKWEQAREVQEMVLAFDVDQTGRQKSLERAREACLRGKRVWILPPEAYGGHKDASAARAAGVLRLPEPEETRDQVNERVCPQLGRGEE